MPRRLVSACLPVLVVAALAAPTHSGQRTPATRSGTADNVANAPKHPHVSCARRAWVLTNVVLDNDIDPPTRQEMFLAGAKALLRAANASLPVGLSRRVSALRTEEELTTFLGDIWPKNGPPAAELEAAMLRGLLRALPGSPPLLSDKDLQAEDQLIHNRYVGTGIQIRMDTKEKLAQIVVTFPGGPARRAGVQPDDLILEVDHVNVRGAGLPKVVELLRGDEGRPVSMLVRQPRATQSRLIEMTRAVIPFETVVGFRRKPDETWQWRVDPAVPVAYVRLTSVTTSCLHELRKIEARLRAEGDQALVLDLRSGVGDDMHPAALVADGLLDGGVMWRVRDARGKVKEYRADPDSLFRDWPLVVLADRHPNGERSFARFAPELIAAALQDNGRAPVVGEPTTGDGHVRTLVHLPDGHGAIRLRTGTVERAGRHATARSAQPEGWSVQPDHTVELTTRQRQDLWEWLIEQERPRPSAAKAAKAPEDPQLAKAIELLRAALRSPNKGAK